MYLRNEQCDEVVILTEGILTSDAKGPVLGNATARRPPKCIQAAFPEHRTHQAPNPEPAFFSSGIPLSLGLDAISKAMVNPSSALSENVCILLHHVVSKFQRRGKLTNDSPNAKSIINRSQTYLPASHTAMQEAKKQQLFMSIPRKNNYRGDG